MSVVQAAAMIAQERDPLAVQAAAAEREAAERSIGVERVRAPRRNGQRGFLPFRGGRRDGLDLRRQPPLAAV